MISIRSTCHPAQTGTRPIPWRVWSDPVRRVTPVAAVQDRVSLRRLIHSFKWAGRIRQTLRCLVSHLWLAAVTARLRGSFDPTLRAIRCRCSTRTNRHQHQQLCRCATMRWSLARRLLRLWPARAARRTGQARPPIHQRLRCWPRCLSTLWRHRFQRQRRILWQRHILPQQRLPCPWLQQNRWRRLPPRQRKHRLCRQPLPTH